MLSEVRFEARSDLSVATDGNQVDAVVGTGFAKSSDKFAGEVNTCIGVTVDHVDPTIRYCKLRHPRLLGLRDDKPAEQVSRERPGH